MKDRRDFRIVDGFRPSRGKRAPQQASRAQGISQNTAKSVPFLLREQVGDSPSSALKASEQRLSALLHDRSRIGRELHDSVLHALYAIGASLAQPPNMRRGTSSAVQASQQQAADQLHRLIQDIRRMILSVESDTVEPFSLVSELRFLAQTFEQMSGSRIRVEVEPAAEEILTGEEAHEFAAIAREALNNCVRHAQATQTVIALRRIGSRVRLRIRDNGSGFDVTPRQAKGVGFAHMENRARKIGGRLNIQSTIGRGTCITADIYLEPRLTTI